MKRRTRFAALLICLGLVAAACGGDDSSGDSTTTTKAGGTTATTVDAATTTLAPQKGGSISIGTFAEAPGVDPITTSGAGTTYGNEAYAIYDRMVNWDPVAKKYTGKTAESFSNNADFTEWTFKLRPNIKFGDGTAYDAAAVKFNFDRQKTSNTILRGVLAFMKEVTVVDPLTVKVTLTTSWPGFITLVANALGMIASPTAVQKGGTSFATNPVGAGAGPFEFVSLKPKEALTLKKNPNYWGGEVFLDELKFVFIAGAQATYDAMKSGTLDFGFLREPLVVADAKKAGIKGITTVMSAGEMLLINHGAEVTCAGGKPEPLCVGQADGAKIASKVPGASKTVRLALQAALDIKTIDTRANQGTGRLATGLLDSTFAWDPKVNAPAPNADQAKKLVAQAKSEGWDGKIKLSCTNTPARQGVALATQAMLNAAGIEVEMSRSNLDVNQVIADVITNKNFELACWGVATPPDDWAYTQLESFLRSTSGSNRAGYKSSAMDAALDELRQAPTDAAKTTAYGKIAKLFFDDVVAVPTAHAEEYFAYSARVQNVVASSFTTVQWEKVWVTKK